MERMSVSEGMLLFQAAGKAVDVDRLALIEAQLAGRCGPIVDGIRRRLDARLEELVAQEADDNA